MKKPINSPQDAQKHFFFSSQEDQLRDFLFGQDGQSIAVLIDDVKRIIKIKFLSKSIALAASYERIKADDPKAYVLPDVFAEYELSILGNTVKTGRTGT